MMWASLITARIMLIFAALCVARGTAKILRSIYLLGSPRNPISTKKRRAIIKKMASAKTYSEWKDAASELDEINKVVIAVIASSFISFSATVIYISSITSEFVNIE